MNKLDFTKLVEGFKGEAFKSVTFKLAKLGNFDGVRD
jgi:hypothetical protein